MMNQEIEQVHRIALEAAIKASQATLRYWPNPGNPKLDSSLKLELFHKTEGKGNYATTADYTSREVINSVLEQYDLLATHGVNSEESEEKRNQGASWQWLIDEIDGTQNFDRGSHLFGVNLGVFYEGLPAVGILAMPALGKIITARNGIVMSYNMDGVEVERLQPLLDKRIPLNLARVGFDLPYASRKAYLIDLVSRYADHVGATLEFNSCAASNYEVICGSFDGYITPKPTWYDIGAPLVIMSALGVVSDLDGNKIKYTPGSEAPSYITTRTQELHRQLLGIINS